MDSENASMNESQQSEELCKQLKDILSTLTLQTVAAHMKLVNDLKINCAEQISDCVDVIFDKALDDPNNAQAYAQLSVQLFTLRARMARDPVEKIGFQNLLITRCQAEFERNIQKNLSSGRRSYIVETAGTARYTNGETNVLKQKQNSLGLMRYIGELFKLNVFSDGVMHDCIRKLLKDNHDEKNLESLCYLLTVVGKTLDQTQTKNPALLDTYFEHLSRLQQLQSISASLRSAILSCINLRKLETSIRAPKTHLDPYR